VALKLEEELWISEEFWVDLKAGYAFKKEREKNNETHHL